MNKPNAKDLNWGMSGITLVMQFLLLGALSYPVMEQASYTITDINPLNDVTTRPRAQPASTTPVW
jgi:hypothetical protein